MKPGIYVSKIQFSDGTVLHLNPTDIIVLTGPNNSGKSTVIREIHNKLSNGQNIDVALSDVGFTRLGDDESVRIYLEGMRGADGHLRIDGASYGYGHLNSFTRVVDTPVATALTSYLDTQTRLNLCNPTSRENLGLQPAQSALSALEVDSEREEKISKMIRENFGFDLILNRAGGSHLELVIDRNAPKFGKEDYHKRSYYEWITSLSKLTDQGDGVKSYTGILLSLFAQKRSLLLIDEPEAFLHPPQARAIAHAIANDAGGESQIFIATHSDDFVRGLLDADSDRIKVVRLQRKPFGEKEVNTASTLDQQKVRELWKDAILRTSDVLSGLFHQAVVIVEGETDARFLRSALDASSFKKFGVPDVKLTYGTGFGSVAKIAMALRAVAVPTVTVLDQDVLLAGNELRKIVAAFGGHFEELRENYSRMTTWLNGKNGAVSSGEIEAKIRKVFGTLDTTKPYTSVTRNSLKSAIAIETSSDKLKSMGRNFFIESLHNAGDTEQANIQRALEAYDWLISKLESLGIYFYPTGELERFSPNDFPKQNWLDRVLIRNFDEDSFLAEARSFTANLISGVRRQIETA